MGKFSVIKAITKSPPYFCLHRGLYFEKHLKFIKHNSVFVPFSKMDLSYLLKVRE